MYKRTAGFTLFEMLIVISILSILVMLSMVSFISVQKNARDSRRKADLEQIRAAIEQWRSDKGSYPNTTTLVVGCGDTNLIDGANIYLQKVPKDPQCSTRTYKYVNTSASDYTLGAGLEMGGALCQSLTAPACGTGIDCTYCVGPYGKKS